MTCVGKVEVKDLLSTRALDKLKSTGGWGEVVNKGSAATGSTGAVLIKLEYNTGDTFNGESVGGTFNNAEVLY